MIMNTSRYLLSSIVYTYSLSIQSGPGHISSKEDLGEKYVSNIFVVRGASGYSGTARIPVGTKHDSKVWTVFIYPDDDSRYFFYRNLLFSLRLELVAHLR